MTRLAPFKHHKIARGPRELVNAIADDASVVLFETYSTVKRAHLYR
jgi:hypothetical protein